MQRFAFSNFQRLSTPLHYGGVDYPTTEHFYQAMKTADPTERYRISLLATPGMAKRAGSKPWTNPKFDRLKVMKYALEHKFSPGSPEARRLMNYPGVLVEWNMWHDNFWGICRCQRCPGDGQNHLGKLLTEIRQQLIAQPSMVHNCKGAPCHICGSQDGSGEPIND